MYDAQNLCGDESKVSAFADRQIDLQMVCFFNAHKLRILFFPFLAQAGSVRDSMAKSLYSAMFDWIVFRTNHALLNNKDLEHSSKVGIKTYTNTSQNPVSVSLVLVLSKIMKMFLVFFLF